MNIKYIFLLFLLKSVNSELKIPAVYEEIDESPTQENSPRLPRHPSKSKYDFRNFNFATAQAQTQKMDPQKSRYLRQQQVDSYMRAYHQQVKQAIENSKRVPKAKKIEKGTQTEPIVTRKVAKPKTEAVQVNSKILEKVQKTPSGYKVFEEIDQEVQPSQKRISRVYLGSDDLLRGLGYPQGLQVSYPVHEGLIQNSHGLPPKVVPVSVKSVPKSYGLGAYSTLPQTDLENLKTLLNQPAQVQLSGLSQLLSQNKYAHQIPQYEISQSSATKIPEYEILSQKIPVAISVQKSVKEYTPIKEHVVDVVPEKSPVLVQPIQIDTKPQKYLGLAKAQESQEKLAGLDNVSILKTNRTNWIREKREIPGGEGLLTPMVPKYEYFSKNHKKFEVHDENLAKDDFQERGENPKEVDESTVLNEFFGKVKKKEKQVQKLLLDEKFQEVNEKLVNMEILQAIDREEKISNQRFLEVITPKVSNQTKIQKRKNLVKNIQKEDFKRKFQEEKIPISKFQKEKIVLLKNIQEEKVLNGEIPEEKTSKGKTLEANVIMEKIPKVNKPWEKFRNDFLPNALRRNILKEKIPGNRFEEKFTPNELKEKISEDKFQGKLFPIFLLKKFQEEEILEKQFLMDNILREKITKYNFQEEFIPNVLMERILKEKSQDNILQEESIPNLLMGTILKKKIPEDKKILEEVEIQEEKILKNQYQKGIKIQKSNKFQTHKINRKKRDTQQADEKRVPSSGDNGRVGNENFPSNHKKNDDVYDNYEEENEADDDQDGNDEDDGNLTEHYQDYEEEADDLQEPEEISQNNSEIDYQTSHKVSEKDFDFEEDEYGDYQGDQEFQNEDTEEIQEEEKILKEVEILKENFQEKKILNGKIEEEKIQKDLIQEEKTQNDLKFLENDFRNLDKNFTEPKGSKDTLENLNDLHKAALEDFQKSYQVANYLKLPEISLKADKDSKIQENPEKSFPVDPNNVPEDLPKAEKRVWNIEEKISKFEKELGIIQKKIPVQKLSKPKISISRRKYRRKPKSRPKGKKIPRKIQNGKRGPKGHGHPKSHGHPMETHGYSIESHGRPMESHGYHVETHRHPIETHGTAIVEAWNPHSGSIGPMGPHGTYMGPMEYHVFEEKPPSEDYYDYYGEFSSKPHNRYTYKTPESTVYINMASLDKTGPHIFPEFHEEPSKDLIGDFSHHIPITEDGKNVIVINNHNDNHNHGGNASIKGGHGHKKGHKRPKGRSRGPRKLSRGRLLTLDKKLEKVLSKLRRKDILEE